MSTKQSLNVQPLACAYFLLAALFFAGGLWIQGLNLHTEDSRVLSWQEVHPGGAYKTQGFIAAIQNGQLTPLASSQLNSLRIEGRSPAPMGTVLEDGTSLVRLDGLSLVAMTLTFGDFSSAEMSCRQTGGQE